MRLMEPLNHWFRSRMRGAARAVAECTHRRWKGKRTNTSKQPKSPLYQAALTTERSLWAVKLEQRPKSFWYRYPTLRNLQLLDQLLAQNGLEVLKLYQGRNAKLADI